jgi:hypothetical protein
MALLPEEIDPLRALTYKLLDIGVRPASRANELAALRLRLAAELGGRDVPAEERALARSLRAMRIETIDALGELQGCARCGRGHPLPNGRWDGGYCCGGTTENLFTQEEIASLRASGTDQLDLRPPRSSHAGCAFRGPTGCSLRPAHRPNLCVRYLCRDLVEELEARGDLKAIRAIASRMQRAFARYAQLRDERIERELLGKGLSSAR